MNTVNEIVKTITDIDKYAFLTGSRAWGTSKKDSDYELVVNQNRRETLEAQLNIDPGAYFESATVHASDGIVNIIYLPFPELQLWRDATYLMRALKVAYVRGKNKQRLHAAFEGIRAILKGLEA